MISIHCRLLRTPAFALALAIASCIGASCTVGPDFVRPQPRPTTDYRSDPRDSNAEPVPEALAQHAVVGQAITVDWWTLFQCDELNSLVAQAIEGNQTLEAARATLARARELASASAGARYPQVGVTAGTGRQKYGEQFLGNFAAIPPFGYYSLGAAVSYTFDFSGGIRRSVEQQNAFAESARQELAAAYLTLTGSVVTQALAIAAYREEITAVERILTQDRENLQLVQTAYDAGSVARADVVSAESQLANDRTYLPPLRQELNSARHALAVLLGRPPGTYSPPDFALSQFVLPHDLPVSLPSELARRRPDILAAEAELHAATAAVGVATANLYPHVTLTGTVGPQSTELAQLFDSSKVAWSAIAALTAPVFDGGTLRAERRAAFDAMQSRAATYQQVVLEAFGQVADRLDALDHDAEQRAAQTRALEAAEANLTFARAGFAVGNSGVLAVLDAERQSQQARVGYARAESRQYEDTVLLFLALGGNSPSAPGAAGLPSHSL
jgi:NodT family efflux transporter outer membrane factor (OMF) lipoprotein